MVLDLMLPGEDGLSICRRLRGTGNAIPIIMLTAKGDDVDRIVGLEMGADDYLPKPFNPRELVARIKAVLRRRAAPPPPGAPTAEAESVELRRHDASTSPRATLDARRQDGRAHHRRVRAAQGAGAASAQAALARQADGARARPRVRGVRPLDRRAGLAPAQADRGRPVATRATSRPSGASATSSCPTARRRDELFPRSLLWRTFLLLAALIARRGRRVVPDLPRLRARAARARRSRSRS